MLFNSTLHSLPRHTSDHVPLLVTTSSSTPVSQVFRYEKSWGLHPSFCARVHNVWSRPQNAAADLVAHLDRSLKWTCVECKKWAWGRNRPDVVVAACDLVVELVDLLEEVRPLAPQELIVAYDVVVELVDLRGCPPSRPVLAI